METTRDEKGDTQGDTQAKTGLVHKQVTTDKPEARAKETDTRKNTSRNKRLRKWLQSLSSSLALQACRSEAVTRFETG